MFETVLLKYDGALREVPVSELDMDPEHATDAEIKTAVARHLEVDSLDEYVVERSEEGKIINLRPTATFGQRVD